MKAYQAGHLGQSGVNPLCLVSNPTVNTDEHISERNFPVSPTDTNNTTYFCPNCEPMGGQDTIACEECDS